MRTVVQRNRLLQQELRENVVSMLGDNRIKNGELVLGRFRQCHHNRAKIITGRTGVEPTRLRKMILCQNMEILANSCDPIKNHTHATTP